MVGNSWKVEVFPADCGRFRSQIRALNELGRLVESLDSWGMMSPVVRHGFDVTSGGVNVLLVCKSGLEMAGPLNVFRRSFSFTARWFQALTIRGRGVEVSSHKCHIRFTSLILRSLPE